MSKIIVEVLVTRTIDLPEELPEVSVEESQATVEAGKAVVAEIRGIFEKANYFVSVEAHYCYCSDEDDFDDEDDDEDDLDDEDDDDDEDSEA